MNDAGTEAEGSSRRDRILAAAERLFQHYGQKKTTMADIAREVGIGVGSVYLDFPSKESLVAELATLRTKSVVTAMRAAADRSPAGERLAAMLVARVEALLEEAGRGLHACDLVSCASSASATSGAQMFGSEVRALLAAELVRAEVPAADREPTLDAIELAFGVLSPPWLFKLPRDKAVDVARKLGGLVSRGLPR